ncbi:MAG: potassium-transporting ATPase subunit C [Solirubrobacterales bacterium]
MRRNLLQSVTGIAIFSVLLGLVYPLALTGISQVLFPGRADGSRIEQNGRAVGSSLIGQSFARPVLGAGGKPRTDADGNLLTRPDRRYFQSRPSVTGYSADVTYFNNLGPNDRQLEQLFAKNARAYLALERPYDPGLTLADVPPDAVQTSASGVDPHISQANAAIQAHRVATVRGLSLGRVRELIDANTDGRFASVLGEPGVNVLELNLDLDRESAR